MGLSVLEAELELFPDKKTNLGTRKILKSQKGLGNRNTERTPFQETLGIQGATWLLTALSPHKVQPKCNQ